MSFDHVPPAGPPHPHSFHRRLRLLIPRLTSRFRVLPDFVVIGAQRCGTTSLFRDLSGHPCVAPAAAKEIHYFDVYHHKGLGWYKQHFPLAFTLNAARRIRRQISITGEASPYYFFHPRAPARLHEAMPDARLILLLRNPVDRAYSHFHHEREQGYEPLSSLRDAIQEEPGRLAGEREKLLADPRYFSFRHNHFSYLARGIYIDQLKAWRAHFPAERIHVLFSEVFFERTGQAFSELLDFLGLHRFTPPAFQRLNRIEKSDMDPALRRELLDYFEPHNRALAEYLGKDPGWTQ